MGNQALSRGLISGVRYLIIDEKSMIGLQMLYWIDRRCQQIFLDRREEPFAGLNIILAGDFFQLPPVPRKALFTPAKQPFNCLIVEELYAERNASLSGPEFC
ncbi:uncharacterized protein N7515_002596 [Penicillium bovifimosum]|uniref:ATP-dependent DNA helicase n=1 Tax=Penicillium bovifimosum TaxID=126998 RepID=A0A9W9HC87_9EURO|nr:uncharacterized protein N7515_002596 [Penicillium bovifimosum]KAJ5143809.1 hypothetical protein N7515_002596 [Penicillium bovifimosum]